MQPTFRLSSISIDTIFIQNVSQIMASIQMDFSRMRTVTAFLNMTNALRVIIVMKTMKQVDVFQIKHHVNLGISQIHHFQSVDRRMGYAKNIPMQRDARTMTVNQYHVIDMGYLVLVV